MAQPPIKKGALDSTDLGLPNRAVVTDVTNRLPAVDGSLLVNVSYDVAVFKFGKIFATSEEIARFVPPREFTIPNTFVGSRSSSRTVTAAAANFEIRKNGSAIGLVQYALGNSTATFANAGGSPAPVGPFVFTSSDTLTIVALTADSNQEDISIAIKAEVT